MSALEYWLVQLLVAAILRRVEHPCSCYGCLTFHPCDYPTRVAALRALEVLDAGLA